jgi:hypothetical protein
MMLPHHKSPFFFCGFYDFVHKRKEMVCRLYRMKYLYNNEHLI